MKFENVSPAIVFLDLEDNGSPCFRSVTDSTTVMPSIEMDINNMTSKATTKNVVAPTWQTPTREFPSLTSNAMKMAIPP